MLHRTKSGEIPQRSTQTAASIRLTIGRSTMFEQISQQLLNASKQYAETIVKANTLAVDHFEKLVDLQLKTIENRSVVVADFVEVAASVKSPEDFRALLPKSVTLVKESAEKTVAVSQEIGHLFNKTGEQFVNLMKGQYESANDTIVKSAKVASKK
jgi:phasin family protein